MEKEKTGFYNNNLFVSNDLFSILYGNIWEKFSERIEF